MTRNARIVSHGSVACVAAALSAAVTLTAVNFTAPSLAQTPAPQPGPFLVQPLADLPGREVRMILLDRPPASASAPHHHPGHHTFGYVIEGTYEIGINGQKTRTLKAGETFYEKPGDIHSVSHNPSPDKGLKIVVFMVADAKNPSTVTP